MLDFSGFLSARFPYAHNPFDGMMNSVSEGVVSERSDARRRDASEP